MKFYSKLSRIQEKYPLMVILVLLTVTMFFGYYAIRVETDSNFQVMFGEDSETIKLQELLSNTFGSTDTLFVLVQINDESNEQSGIKDIRDPSVMHAMQQLSLSLKEETAVASTANLADIMMIFYGRLPGNLEESKKMINDLPEFVKESYLSSFLSEDYTSQNMILSVDVAKQPGSVPKIEKIVREKIKESPFPLGIKTTLTGLPVLINRLLNFIIIDNIKTIGLAILGVFFILWYYFRSYKIAFFSIIPVVLTLIWLAGTMQLLDIRITVMVASIGAMIVGMSVDYAIHLTHAYHLHVREGEKHAAIKSVTSVGPALFASVMTTTVGFLALTLGVTPNSQTQGTVLAFGIVFAFIITLIGLPALMVLQRKYVYSKLDEVVFRIRGKKEAAKQGLIEKFLNGLATWQSKSPTSVLLFVVFLTIALIPGFGLVYLDTGDDGWVPDVDPVVQSLEELELKFGGTDSMNLLVRVKDATGDYDSGAITDLRDPRIMTPMSRLDKVIEDLDWVDVVESPTNDIRQLNNNVVPQNLETTKDLFDKNPTLSDKFNDDYSLAKITLRADFIEYPEFFELMDEVSAMSFPNEIEIIPQGGVPEDMELEAMLSSDTMRTTGLGFIFVMIVATVLYSSVVAGLLAFIPILIAVVWTVGTMGYINLPFTVLTTGMLAILMGLGIDFSIHIMHAIKENMKKYGTLKKAITESLLSTGEAISITTITTVFGFMVLTFATLTNTKRLGWTLAVGIIATFFACMLIVPAVMALRYKLRGVRDE